MLWHEFLGVVVVFGISVGGDCGLCMWYVYAVVGCVMVVLVCVGVWWLFLSCSSVFCWRQDTWVQILFCRTGKVFGFWRRCKGKGVQNVGIYVARVVP